MRVIILSSGGKDSCYSVWWALMKGWDIAAIVTVRISSDDSLMFQLPATDIAGLQSKSAGIPWIPLTVSGQPEAEIDELESKLRNIISGEDMSLPKFESKYCSELYSEPMVISTNGPINAIVTGALRSDYQKTRIERMANNLGIISFTPLWHHDPYEHMIDLIRHGFRLQFTSVSAEGLDKKWLGKVLDSHSLTELNELAEKYRFSIDGEGGEFETTVIGSPWMNNQIEIKGDIIWFGKHGYLDIISSILC
ncbi:MAG: hypothetical protein CMO20_03640 [Thermoplasmata archaeon]|nr:hypothetical protein [Thermoplasmata archaeon]